MFLLCLFLSQFSFAQNSQEHVDIPKVGASAISVETTQADDKPEPFSFADFSWVPGNYAPSENVFATKYFSPELRVDNVYHSDFNHFVQENFKQRS
jgi:hypothetical protein